MTGILLVDKPEGTTSAGVIRALKPRLAGARVGHLGTLDPFASGLLPLCLGEATKVARYLLLEEKAYTGTIQLGVATDTLDCTGATLETAAIPPLDRGALDGVLARFLGHQRQVPPMYSALKRDGVPLYKLARRGVEVPREARDIEIRHLTLALAAPDRLDFVVECSKGTYVRVLAADIGVALGTVAHLATLRRTRVGRFTVDDAAPPEALLLSTGALPLVGVREALADYTTFPVAAEGLARLRHGQQDPLGRLPPPRGRTDVALVLDPAGAVAAVIEAGEGRWRIARLLGTP